jgi:hypothetical protein
MSTIDIIIPFSIALAEEEDCSRKISNESNTTQSSNGTQYTTCSEQLPYSEHSTTGRTQSESSNPTTMLGSKSLLRKHTRCSKHSIGRTQTESSNPWVPMPDTQDTHGTHDSLGAHNIHGTTPKKISVVGRQQAEYGQYYV